MNHLVVLMRFLEIFKEKLAVDATLFVKLTWLKLTVNVKKLAQSLTKPVMNVSLVAIVKKEKFLIKAQTNALNPDFAHALISYNQNWTVKHVSVLTILLSVKKHVTYSVQMVKD